MCLPIRRGITHFTETHHVLCSMSSSTSEGWSAQVAGQFNVENRAESLKDAQLAAQAGRSPLQRDLRRQLGIIT